VNDFRYALRALRGSAGFTAVVIVAVWSQIASAGSAPGPPAAPQKFLETASGAVDQLTRPQLKLPPFPKMLFFVITRPG